MAFVLASCASSNGPDAAVDEPPTSIRSVDPDPEPDPDPGLSTDSDEDTATTAPVATDPPVADEEGSDVFRELNEAEAERFRSLSAEDDGPFFMINFIKYREQAEYPDGRASDLTGFQADAIYSEFMQTVKFPEIGARSVYAARVEGDTIGGSDFDVVAVIEYPSRAAWASMEESADYRDTVIHKEAGVEKTLVLAASRLDLPVIPPVTDPPFPATADDAAFAFVHVFDYRDTAEYAADDDDADPSRSGEEAVGLYSANAGEVALPLGVRALAFFEVEATLVGPANTWEEVRINLFPSHRTLDELTSSPVWQAGYHHREAGLEQTYAIQSLPLLNDLGS